MILALRNTMSTVPRKRRKSRLKETIAGGYIYSLSAGERREVHSETGQSHLRKLQGSEVRTLAMPVSIMPDHVNIPTLQLPILPSPYLIHSSPRWPPYASPHGEPANPSAVTCARTQTPDTSPPPPSAPMLPKTRSAAHPRQQICNKPPTHSAR